MRRILKTICVLSVALPAVALARSTVDRTAFDRFMLRATGSSTYELGIGGAGKPLTTSVPSPAISGARQLGNMVVFRPAASGMGVMIGGRAFMPLGMGSGGAFVNVASRVSIPSLVAAAGRCLGNVVCLAATTIAGAALSEWLSDAGYSVNPDGTFTATGAIPTAPDYELINGQRMVCTIANIPNYPASMAGACSAFSAQVRGNASIGKVVDYGHGIYRCDVGAGWHESIVCRSDMRPAQAPTWENVADALSSTQPPLGVVEELLNNGETVVVEPPSVTGPAEVAGQTSTVTENRPNPETGQMDRIDIRTENNWQLNYNSNQVTIRPNTTVTTFINGRPVLVSNPTQPKPPEEMKLETCGLPGKPACKIDETDTPQKVEDTHKADVDAALAQVGELAKNPAKFWPELPQINWTFTLPTGCSAIQTPAFSPYFSQIDVCKFQPVFHDVMSVFWIMGGIIGAIGLFWQSVFAQSN